MIIEWAAGRERGIRQKHLASKAATVLHQDITSVATGTKGRVVSFTAAVSLSPCYLFSNIWPSLAIQLFHNRREAIDYLESVAQCSLDPASQPSFSTTP